MLSWWSGLCEISSVEVVGGGAITVILSILAVILFVLSSLLWLGWKKEGRRGDVCPYSGKPMRLGMDVARSIAGFVQAFLSEQQKPDNPPIDFVRAAYCPETGRIFPECVSSNEQVVLSWNFIQKRCRGTFVSWGSLSPEEQGVVKLLHDSLEGFQTESSSKISQPERVEETYALCSPGPLYIDRSTKILLGWKKVPGTYFEVLVVQHPKYSSLEETL